VEGGPPSFDFLGKLLDWSWAACMAVVSVFWRKLSEMEKNSVAKADFEALVRKVDGKANNDEMDRQRDNIASLFDGQTAIREDMHKNTRDILTAVGALSREVGQVIGQVNGERHRGP
jgi:hypothetical protein